MVNSPVGAYAAPRDHDEPDRCADLLAAVLTLTLVAAMLFAASASAYVYWADSQNSRIGRANTDGTDVNESFFATGGDEICGVAVDDLAAPPAPSGGGQGGGASSGGQPGGGGQSGASQLSRRPSSASPPASRARRSSVT